jgi:hypothetical protein
VSLSIAMLTPMQVLCVAFGLHTHISSKAWRRAKGFVHWPCCHGGPWDETQAGGETVEGSTVIFCQPTREQLVSGIETPTQWWREHSACCAVAMVRSSPRWWYNLSTPSTEGVGNVSRSAATTATF